MANFNAQSFDKYRQYLAQIKEKTQKPEYQAYQSIVFSFLAISLFGWFAIRPTVQTIILLRREIADKTILSSAMSEKISSLIEAQSAYEDVNSKLVLVDQALPRSPSIVELVDQISKLVNANGASISGLSISETELSYSDNKNNIQANSEANTNETINNPNQKSEIDQTNTLVNSEQTEINVQNLPKIKLSLSVAGDYIALENIAKSINNLRRITNATSYTFSIPKNDISELGQGSNNLTLEVQLESYYLGR